MPVKKLPQNFMSEAFEKIKLQEKLDSWNQQLTRIYQISQRDPKHFQSGNTRLWAYQNSLYEVTGTYSDEEKKLLILEFVDKERQKFERLKRKFSQTDSEELKYERTRIPESVRIAVWRRDQGKCAKCGSRENLEYDHIVPVSKGGSNTARNIELLCQDCNRAKGNRIE